MYAKDTKEIRKQKKKKKKGKEKYENGPRGTIPAQIRKGARGPSSLSRNGIPVFPLPR
jgi:hypothetical protein